MMSIYKNISGVNQDTKKTNTSGALSGNVGKILPNETFEAADLGGVLKIMSMKWLGQYVYDKPSVFAIQSSAPPIVTPPASTDLAFTVTVSLDGYASQTITGALKKQ